MEEFALVRDFAIIMAVAGAALVLFRQFGQPPILGYLLAGVIVGPFTLPDPPVRDTETIRLLADLGLVLLLFAIGLEFGWERIRQVGLRVIFIGAIEIGVLLALGYEIGLLLGWTGKEAIFLGSALSVSSSAILVKMLRDSGRLQDADGRLIVGILVVEDFAAVVLLSILSAVASTDSFNPADVGILMGKLGIFAVAALVFGALLAPGLMKFVAKFQSQETLLITGLALCFGLAVVAHELGISAAAGAFLIGTVLGDTKQSQDLLQTMSPVRDMFAAIFFVSIGMLVDFALIQDFIVPALIVSAVFVLGKVLAITTGTFVSGEDGRTSLRVGMGTPQIGEFSLAMVKVGSDHGAVGSFLYPVVTVTTAITAVIYPIIFRSPEITASFLERRSPRLLRQYVSSLESWFLVLRSAFSLKSDAARQIKRTGQLIFLNLGIVVLLLAAGTMLLRFTDEFSDLMRLRESIVGLIIGFGTVALCTPSVIALWRELHGLAESLTAYLVNWGFQTTSIWGLENLQTIIRDSLLAAVAVLVVIWAIPFVFQLLSIGQFATPVPILLLGVLVLLTAKAAFKIHAILVATFSRTFLGPGNPDTPADSDSSS